MEETTSRSFDFDALRELARSDPEGFEDRRRALIEDLIGQAPQWQQRRLRGLQWRVDMERQRASNPLAACIVLSRMMWESVAGHGGLLETIESNGTVPHQKTDRNADVIVLERRDPS